VLAKQALRQTGNYVLVTQNPLEVLDLARRVRIDLLVTDVDSRPGIVEQVRVTQPDVRVLYLSDITDAEPADVERSLPLRTPFSVEELRAAIAAQLDGSGSGASVEVETAL
jgi:DNA-binding response OmpR family regulator